jgi:hypothetical protein
MHVAGGSVLRFLLSATAVAGLSAALQAQEAGVNNQRERLTSAPTSVPTSAPTPAPVPIVMTDEGRRIHAGGLLIDGHNDLLWRVCKEAESSFDKLDIALPQPTLQIDIPRLRQGGVGAMFFAVYVPMEAAKDGTAAQVALEQFDLLRAMVKRYPRRSTWRSPQTTSSASISRARSPR